MTYTLNPRAKEFVSKTIILRPSIPSKPSTPSKTNTKLNQLDQLNELSISVAESVLKPISHQELELNLKTRRNHYWNYIPKIDFALYNHVLRKVATINYLTNDITVNLYWNQPGNRAIVDIPNRDYSWELSNRSIRDLIHLIFIEDVKIVNEDHQLDMLVSHAPLLHIDVKDI